MSVNHLMGVCQRQQERIRRLEEIVISLIYDYRDGSNEAELTHMAHLLQLQHEHEDRHGGT